MRGCSGVVSMDCFSHWNTWIECGVVHGDVLKCLVNFHCHPGERELEFGALLTPFAQLLRGGFYNGGFSLSGALPRLVVDDGPCPISAIHLNSHLAADGEE